MCIASAKVIISECRLEIWCLQFGKEEEACRKSKQKLTSKNLLIQLNSLYLIIIISSSIIIWLRPQLLKKFC